MLIENWISNRQFSPGSRTANAGLCTRRISVHFRNKIDQVACKVENGELEPER